MHMFVLTTSCSHHLQFKTSVWCRGEQPECNEKYNCYPGTQLMHLLLFMHRIALPTLHDLLKFVVYSYLRYCTHHIAIHSLH